MSDLLSNPFLLYGAAVAILVVLALLFWLLRSRRVGQSGEGHIRAELAAMERENQLAAAASQVPFSDSPENIATQLATVFRDHLSLQLYRIYAGRDGDGQYLNLLPKEEQGLVTNDLSQAASLPAQIPAPTALNFTWAQTANTNVLLGEIGIGEGEAITVVPWRGPFGWSGLMVANPLPAPPNELLSKLKEPINQLTTKLAVALEIASPHAASPAQANAATLNNFYEMLLQSNDEQSNFQAILQEVTKVSGANSAALWRLDKTSQVLKMESAYGLQTTEFLPQPLGQGLAGTVLDTRMPLALEDAPSDPRCLFPQEARESGVGSYLGIPLMANGTPLGVLEVHTLQPKWWDEQDLNKLEMIARPLTKFMQKNTHPTRSLQAENAYLGLSEALQLLGSADELMSAVVEVLGHALGVSRVAILDLTKEVATIAHEYKDANARSSLGNTFRSAAMQRIRNITTQDKQFFIADSPQQSMLGEQMAGALEVSSELAFPVKQHGQPTLLILLHQSGQPREWTPGEIEFTERVGRQLALSLAHLEAKGTPANLSSENGTKDNRVQTVLNNLPEALIGLDQNGRISFFNQKAENWFGVTQSDVGNAATLVDALAMTDEYFWNRVIACKENSRFEGYLKPSSERHIQTPGAKGTTDKIALNVSVAPLRNQDGTINGFLVSLSDVRHLKVSTSDISKQITELNEEKVRTEKSLADVKSAELQARARIEKLNSLAASGKNVGDEIRRLEAEFTKEREQFREKETNMQRTFQQQLAINQMKNEFIVNSGKDISRSVQTIMKKTELLKSGTLGPLNESQRQALDELLKLSRETSNSVNDLIDYGSSRRQ